jgi:hypothetical protein
MFSLLDGSLADDVPSQGGGDAAPVSVLHNLSRNPSVKPLNQNFEFQTAASSRASPIADAPPSRQSGGLFSPASTIHSNKDPLENIKRVDSVNSQSFPSHQPTRYQFGGALRLPPAQPTMRLRSSTDNRNKYSSSGAEDNKPPPLSTPTSAAALESLLFGGPEAKATTAGRDVQGGVQRGPRISVEIPTPYQSVSKHTSNGSSDMIPSTKQTPTLPTDMRGGPSSFVEPVGVRKWGEEVRTSSTATNATLDEWAAMRGPARAEVSCLLDSLYFKTSVQHFLDFGDTIGNSDKNGEVLCERDVRDVLLPARSADVSLHALQARLLHQLHLIDLPDLEKARVAEGKRNSNNFIVRSILNSRQAQNTELLPVRVGATDDDSEQQYQSFSCGFCGLGEHGEPALLLVDARYHGPGERIDHCPNCGMYQGA